MWPFTKREPKVRKYWVVRKTFTGVQIEYSYEAPKLYGLDVYLEGPLDTKEQAIEAFKFWTTNKNYGGR